MLLPTISIFLRVANCCVTLSSISLYLHHNDVGVPKVPRRDFVQRDDEAVLLLLLLHLILLLAKIFQLSLEVVFAVEDFPLEGHGDVAHSAEHGGQDKLEPRFKFIYSLHLRN